MAKALLYFTGASALWAVASLSNIQYYFVYEPKSWNDAQSYCRKTYTDLVTVDSAEIMTTLRNMVDWNKMGSKMDAWIGLYDDMNSWRWSLSDDAFYQGYSALYRNWPTGQPDNNDDGEACLEMLAGGEWNDIGCDVLRKPFCLTVSGQSVTYSLVNLLLNWTQAQSYCKTHYTDLISVRTSTENENVKSAKPVDDVVWLGLYRDQWKWSNGSQLTYTYWGFGEPNGPAQNCAAADFGNSGVWVDWECNVTKAFICFHEVPFTKHVMKIKMARSSSVDLEDAAVQKGLLSQLQQKLKDQGVNGDITLKWMKQSDGKVFHQEKQDDRN